jgi:hypothetical protein
LKDFFFNIRDALTTGGHQSRERYILAQRGPTWGGFTTPRLPP